METESRQVAIREPLNLEPVLRLPPTPVLDEHILALEADAEGFVCQNEIDFARGKILRARCTTLKADIESSFKPLKLAIDAIKQPILDKEKTDLAKVKAVMEILDSQSIPWQREQDHLAQEAANRKKAEDLKRKEAEKQKEVEVLKEWGDEEGAKEVSQAPIPPTRPSTASSGFTYARGVRTKPKLKARIVSPDAVKRAFCSPDAQIINFKVSNFLSWNKSPTEEQIKRLAEEIGGIELYWE